MPAKRRRWGHSPDNARPAPPGTTQAEQAETIAGIRFHGNYSIPDTELMQVIGVDIGDALIVIKEPVSVAEKFMFLPVFSWTDEHGVTYGARFTTIDLLGAGERLSFPLTWGGEKQAAIEPSLRLDRAALTRLEGGVSARLDTRQDTQLPRNALYIGAGLERLELLDGNMDFNRPELDLRGYKSFISRSIIASQLYYRGTDGRLPAWERPFLGGAATVRGHDAGEFIGDNIMLASVELRVPLTPPLLVGLVGLDFFFDTGTVYDYGTPLGEAKFHNGVGGGVYFFVASIGLKMDVAYDLDDSVHFHFSTGFRF